MAGLDAEQETTMTRHDRRGANRRLLGLLLIGVGTVWFLEVAGLLSLSAETLLAGLLTLLGVGLIFTARRGRGWWPIALGAILSAVLVLNSNSLQLPSIPGMGDQTITVSSGPRPASYSGAIGDLTVIVPADVSQLPPRIRISAGIGDVKVQVPAKTPFHMTSHIGIGQLTVCGRTLSDGFGSSQTFDHAPPQSDAPTPPLLLLMINDGIGDVRVECP